MDRREFIKGLFGAAVVAAAGPIPEKLLALPEEEFKRVVEATAVRGSCGIEMWANRQTGEYSFSQLVGFIPCRAESNGETQTIQRLYRDWQ